LLFDGTRKKTFCGQRKKRKASSEARRLSPENYFPCPGKTFAAQEKRKPTLPFDAQGKNFFASPKKARDKRAMPMCAENYFVASRKKYLTYKKKKRGTRSIYIRAENNVQNIYCTNILKKEKEKHG